MMVLYFVDGCTGESLAKPDVGHSANQIWTSTLLDVGRSLTSPRRNRAKNIVLSFANPIHRFLGAEYTARPAIISPNPTRRNHVFLPVVAVTTFNEEDVRYASS